MEKRKIRSGEVWFYKANEIMRKYFGEEVEIYYQGFEKVKIDNKGYIAGVFEIRGNVDIAKFGKHVRKYKNKKCGILGILAYKQAGTYRDCVFVILE